MRNTADKTHDETFPATGRQSTDPFRWFALLVITVLVSVAFLDMVSSFLVSLALAAIAAALLEPVYRFLFRRIGNRAGLASLITVLAVLVAVVVPTIMVAVVAQQQAAAIVDMNTLDQSLNKVTAALKLAELPGWLPFRETIVEAAPQIIAKLQELSGAIGSFLASMLVNLAKGTSAFFLNLFIFIYAMWMFLQMETPVLKQLLGFSGLRPETQDFLYNRVVSISRATIKGGLLIGIVQGALGALGFWAAGIEGAALWGIVMVIAAIVPGIGAAFVVVCGAVYLAIIGETGPAIALGIWGVLVVGTIDNVLRPVLVGRDAEMDEVLMLIATLGGLATFGAAGLVLGPVLAGLFVAIWTTLSRSIQDFRGESPETPRDKENQTADVRDVSKEGANEERDTGAIKLTATREEVDSELEVLRRELAAARSGNQDEGSANRD